MKLPSMCDLFLCFSHFLQISSILYVIEDDFVLITFILTNKIKPAGWQQTPQINHTIQKDKIEKEIEKWI
jgi:hypothetical protein